MATLTEAEVEALCLELLQAQGYQYLPPDQQEQEREDFAAVVLRKRLYSAITELNPDIPAATCESAVSELLNISTGNLIDNNRQFHRFFTDGMDVEYQQDGEVRGDKLHIVDFDNPRNNDLVVCNQFTVCGDKERRPDVVIFINGLPLVVIEIKNPTSEQATLESAYNQLQTYKTEIPSLFDYNGALVITDGIEAKIGSLTAGFSRFSQWKKDKMPVEMEALISELLSPDALLGYLRHFVVFEESRNEGLQKKMAACHQYRAVCEAVQRTHIASQDKGDGKVGIVWHSQGSGKSLSMVFYAGKVMLELGNPTLLVVTDRNDLDDQLFDTFAANRALLRQKPEQAESREHLQELLQTTGGGVIFTTIQKFRPEQAEDTFPMLSERRNIVVIADEAHRSHYGFDARLAEDSQGQMTTRYGFAKYLRDALPNASCIAFTATPVEKHNASTRAVFGDEIDIYDMHESVEDGATVPIYYESRLAQMNLDADVRKSMDEEVEALTESPEDQDVTEQAKQKWAKVEAIVGSSKRLDVVAQDIVEHFEERETTGGGKAMIVTMSRRIAVDLYEKIIGLRPQWHHVDKDKGTIKVVMTMAASDPQPWQQHSTSKADRNDLAARLKNPEDSLKLVIVCDMWLTGFDAPCLQTLYIDKVMRGHNLMQAIARVNRVFPGKTGGMIVDYIGFASNLQEAMHTYSDSGGAGKPVLDQQQAINVMREKYEIVVQMFSGFDYKQYFAADTSNKLSILLSAQEHILQLEEGKTRFYKNVGALAQAFKLSLPSEEALAIRDEVALFCAIKARLRKLDASHTSADSDVTVEEAIRQIVDKALAPDGVIDIFDAAGLSKPDLSILSDEFLEQIRGMEHKNLAVEMLNKLLTKEFRVLGPKNVIRTRRFSEMLDEALNKYHNQALSAAQVIEEMIRLAKEMQDSQRRGEEMNLSDDEIAFYDALADNQKARDVLGDDTLCEIAQILVKEVRSSATLDWTIRESVQAQMRLMIKRILKRYGYPPDKEKMAVDNVIEQAKELATEWAESV